MGIFGPLGIAVALAFLWPVVRRANEVFCLSVRNGETLLVRGGLPPSLYQALADVARRNRLAHATLRGVRRDQRAQLDVSGVGAGTAQRLRNVFDSHGGARIGLTQFPPKGRNLGQRLGWIWLAWRLRR